MNQNVPDARRLGQVIKELRREHGLSQEKLAEQLEVDEKTLRSWEHGQVVALRKANRMKLHHVLQIPSEMLGLPDHFTSENALERHKRIHSLDEWEEKIMARVTGELSAEESALLDQHVESCASCVQELREYDFLARRLRSVEQDIVVPAPSPALLALQQEIAQYRIQEEAHQIVEQTFAQASKKRTVEEPPDGVLVELAQAGHLEAFTELYSRHADGVFKYLLDQTHKREDSQDLVQDTFLRCWEHLQGLREPSHFKPWLFTIARNLSRDYFRQQKKAVGIVSFLPDEELQTDLEAQSALVVRNQEEQVLERIALRELFGIAFRQIPSRLQTALSLYLEGHSSQEIASILQVSEAVAKWYVSKGKKVFRQAFAALERDT